MTDTRWLIRMISPTEIDVFRRIRLEALQSEPGSFASTYEDWLHFSSKEWGAQMNIPIFVAFDGDQPVGLMGLKRLAPAKMRHRATLTMVYVNKTFRGTGLATALLKSIMNHAGNVGISQIELGVRADNEPAVRFYEATGFVTIGNIPNGYIDACSSSDETLMVRRLAPSGSRQQIHDQVEQFTSD